MLKTITSIVLATIISTLLLSLIGFVEPFDYDKDDDEKSNEVTTVNVAADQSEDLPGIDACPEETDSSDEAVSDSPSNTTEAPQIDYGWGEEPGPS